MPFHRHHAEIAAACWPQNQFRSVLFAKPPCICRNLWRGVVWHSNCHEDPTGALTRRCQEVSSKHARLPRSGWRTRCVRRETRIEVLLSERNPEPNRSNRTLPLSGLLRVVAFRARARPNPKEGGRALSLLTATQPASFATEQPGEPGLDPLYLFACGVSWRRQANTAAGWELVRCLTISGQTSRIAAALLAQTENMQLPAGKLAGTIDTPRKPFPRGEPALLTGRLGRR